MVVERIVYMDAHLGLVDLDDALHVCVKEGAIESSIILNVNDAQWLRDKLNRFIEKQVLTAE